MKSQYSAILCFIESSWIAINFCSILLFFSVSSEIQSSFSKQLQQLEEERDELKSQLREAQSAARENANSAKLIEVSYHLSQMIYCIDLLNVLVWVMRFCLFRLVIQQSILICSIEDGKRRIC